MRFWGYNLSSKIGIFEQNLFTTAVSIPKSFHITPICPTFEKCQPTLMYHVMFCWMWGLCILFEPVVLDISEVQNLIVSDRFVKITSVLWLAVGFFGGSGAFQIGTRASSLEPSLSWEWIVRWMRIKNYVWKWIVWWVVGVTLPMARII